MTELTDERPLHLAQTPPGVVKDDSEMEYSSRDDECEQAVELEEQQMFCQEDGKNGDDDSHKMNDLEKSKETESPGHNESTRNSGSDPDVKPTHSYIALIAMAILSCPNKKMILGDIYQYISGNFPYYRNKDKSWRNSIRHNLSLNECFIKAGRSENGKGNYWAIHPANLEDFANGDFRRRRARRRVRRSNPLKFGGTSSHSAYFRGISSLSSHTSFLPYGADDYRMYPSLTYIPPTKKSFAIDSIIGSYDSSFLYSPASVRSYPSVGLQSTLDYSFSSGVTQPVLFHTPPALTSYVSEAGSSNSTYSRSTDASAFSTYLAGFKAPITRINTRHESWQETLTKLQEQLRKVTP